MLKSLTLEGILWMDALAVLNNTLQKDSTLHMTLMTLLDITKTMKK